MTNARSISAAQTVPVRGDVEANLARHARLIEAAAAEQAQLLVFPELSLTGYELDLAEALAFGEGDARLAPLVELASARRMTLVVGAPVRLGNRLHIGAFVVGPNRTVELYTKHHVGAGEEEWVSPGTRDLTVRVSQTAAAVAVCADANRSSHAQHAADRGANTYLTSAFVTPSELPAKEATLEGHAVRHSMTVVLSNYGGPSGGLPSGGRSAIWSQKGKLLARAESVGVGLVVATETDDGWSAKAVMLGSS